MNCDFSTFLTLFFAIFSNFLKFYIFFEFSFTNSGLLFLIYVIFGSEFFSNDFFNVEFY